MELKLYRQLTDYLIEEVNIVKDYELDSERKLKLALVQRLIKEGHCKYAQRLRNYKVIIVPLSVDKRRGEITTASMDSENAVIRIGEGFLNMVNDNDDEFVYRQLGVIIRHEMAHDLMKHQIRMAAKLKNDIGEDAYAGMLRLPTMHNFINIVADDEISNTRYSEEDKEIVRNMTLNGQVIGGLITEDHRAGWQDLTVEEMYDRLAEEADALNQELIDYAKANGGLTAEFLSDKAGDFLNRKILQAKAVYARACDPEVPQDPHWVLKPTPKDFLQSEEFKKLNNTFKPMLSGIINYYSDASEDEVVEAMYKLKDSSPFRVVSLADDKVKVASPEEKYTVGEILKNFLNRNEDKQADSGSNNQQGEEGGDNQGNDQQKDGGNQKQAGQGNGQSKQQQGQNQSDDDSSNEKSQNGENQPDGGSNKKKRSKWGKKQRAPRNGDISDLLPPEEGGNEQSDSEAEEGQGQADRNNNKQGQNTESSSEESGETADDADNSSEGSQDSVRGEVSSIYQNAYNETRASLLRDRSSATSRRDRIAAILQGLGARNEN